MSLFTAALAGAGGAVRDTTGTWIKQEAQTQTGIDLAKVNGEIDQQKAAYLESLRAKNDASKRAADRADRDAQTAEALRVEGGAPLAEKYARVASGGMVRLPEGPGEGIDSTRVPETLTPEEQAQVRAAQLGGDRYRFTEAGVGDRATGEFQPGAVAQARTKMIEAQARAADANVDLREAQASRTRRAPAGGADTTLRDANQTVEIARRAVKDAERSALDVLTKNNPDALGMDAAAREKWLSENSRVAAARANLDAAMNARQRLMDADTAPSRASRQPKVDTGDADQPQKPTDVGDDLILQQARDALRRGASREKVERRLRAWGLDASSL